MFAGIVRNKLTEFIFSSKLQMTGGNLCGGKKLLEISSSIQNGQGKNTNLWRDCWLPHGPLFKRYGIQIHGPLLMPEFMRSFKVVIGDDEEQEGDGMIIPTYYFILFYFFKKKPICLGQPKGLVSTQPKNKYIIWASTQYHGPTINTDNISDYEF
jgi:hypothetical protein